jgi:hypothetical protein
MRIFQPTVTGSIVTSAGTTFNGNLSGSHTNLADGSSFLVGGNGVTISTGSSGTVTITAGLPAGFLAQSYGGGFDGNLTVVDGATLTLSRESQYNSITILGSGSIKPAGFRIFCKGNLSISAQGSINDDGIAAINATGSNGLASRGYLGGSSIAGAGGVLIDTNGNNSSTAGNCSFNEFGAFPAGGAGGSAGVRAGGTAITGTLYTFTQTAHTCWQTGRPIFTSAGVGNTGITFNSGMGGSSGGNNTGAAAASGAGGGGGGCVWVCANTISSLGRISANGGRSGNAIGTGNAGGGGGGSGGIVTVITNTPVSSIGGAITVSGGAGGTGIGTGNSGNSGSLGSKVIVSYGGN